MKHLTHLFLLAIAWFYLTPFKLVHAQIVNGDAAVDGLGQYDQTNFVDPVPAYNRGTSNDVPNRIGLNGPRGGAALDSVRHRLFVTDTDNNRVLGYNLTNGDILIDRIPDFVLGQPGFATNASATTRSGMNGPRGLLYDSTHQRLFVSERFNNRVLVFDLSGTTVSNGQDAAFVLGQPDFTTGSSGTTQAKMNTPEGMVIKGSTLFVAQSGSTRITTYDITPGNLANGASAINVLGQPNFTSSSSALSATGLSSPAGLALFGDLLFVADAGNHRVKVYDVASVTDNEAAVNVLGQSDFTTGTSATTQNGMNSPVSVAIDAAGSRLFVSELSNSRALVYSIASITDGENAVNVLGQVSFTANTSGLTRSNLSSPFGVFHNPTTNQLIVSDTGNHRISFFDVASITDGEDATDLLGQFDGSSVSAPVPSYTKGQAHNAPDRLGLGSPTNLAFDTVRHRLFLSDGTNRRVLVFNLDNSNRLIDHVPDNVLGKPNFITSTSVSPTQSEISAPAGIAYDSAGDRLFVADSSWHRILVFDTASISNGENAVNVLGQLNYTTATSGSTAGKLNTPFGLSYDAVNQRLFVADRVNRRVPVFDLATISDGEDAAFVLGQPDFSTTSSGLTSAKLNGPRGVYYDAAGSRLFVADATAHRVMVYDTTSISNGENAVNVLGQASFTSGGSATSQTALNTPLDITYNSLPKLLFVSDNSNRRIMVYNVDSISNGEAAVNVLGQLDFTTASSGLSQTRFNSPVGVAFDGTDRLYVADGSNHRIMVFATAASLSLLPLTFVEAGANDGSIATVGSITLDNTQFSVTSGTLTQNTHFTVANVPAGLTPIVTVSSATTATLTLNGNAASHENADDISNLTITFLDAAFAGRAAANITGSTRSDLSVDFANAPTPTPTATASSTPTSTPTNTPTTSPTTTPTNTPTTTPTNTPTEAPTQLSTPTSIATNTPVPSATATPEATATVAPASTSTPMPSPTPTPTIASTELGGQVLVGNGNVGASISSTIPLAGALVYATGLGADITDEGGFFRIAGAREGKAYEIFVRRDGVAFPVGQLSGQPGQFVAVMGVVDEMFNPKQCAVKDTSLRLFNGARFATELRDRVAAQRTRLVPTGRRIDRLALLQLNSYLASSARIPTLILDCSEVSQCGTVSLAKERKWLLGRLADLRRQNLLVNRKLRTMGRRSAKASERIVREIIRIHRNGVDSIRGIPREGGACSN